MNEITYDEYGYPAATPEGVRCGNHPKFERVKHVNAEAVRMCYAIMRAEIADQEAEIAAGRAIERHFEDRGWAEAQAQRDWEDRNGVIQFDQAYRMACPELFQD